MGATRVISFVNALRQYEINNIHTREKCRWENFKMAIKIAVILGSTRPGRNGEAVARWVYEIAKKRADAEFEFVDIKDFNLPLLDEPVPPSQGQYSKEHTRVWSAKIDSFDGYIFVTAEYNHGIPGALKNAIDYLYKEWNNKAAGFVDYGSAGGVRAVEHLRLVMAELQVANVPAQVAVSIITEFENFTKFKPASYQEKLVNIMSRHGNCPYATTITTITFWDHLRRSGFTHPILSLTQSYLFSSYEIQKCFRCGICYKIKCSWIFLLARLHILMALRALADIPFSLFLISITKLSTMLSSA
jgi:NAD(P)H-dependent FMN reductase